MALVGHEDVVFQPDPAFGAADLRVAPASPGKALRLRPFLMQSRGTLYVNLEEAGLLCDHRFDATPEAARALLGELERLAQLFNRRRRGRVLARRRR